MSSKAWFGAVVGVMAVAACESTDDTVGSSYGGRAGGAGHAGSSAGSTTRGGAGSGGAAGASTVSGATNAAASGSGENGSQAGFGGNDVGSGGASNAGGNGDSGGDGTAGDSTDGGEAGAPAGVPAVAYVSTLFGDLLVASVDNESGTLSLLPSSPVKVAKTLNGVVVAPDGKFVFVPADPARIDTYPIAADGSLPAEPSSSTTVDDDEPLLTMALDPQGRFAYGVSPFSSKLYVFTVNRDTGKLSASGEPLLIGPVAHRRSPAFAAPDPNGHFVYVTQMADGSPVADNGIRGYAVDQTTGALTELAGSPFGGVNVFAGALVFRPDGKFLYSSGGALNAFAVDAESGALDLVPGSPFTEDIGSDPWAPTMAIDPRGKLLYVTHFQETRHITGFVIDPSSGALDRIEPPITSPAPYSIALGPGGRFLYVGEDSGQLSIFKVARPSGTLTPVEGSPFLLGGLEADLAFVTLP